MTTVPVPVPVPAAEAPAAFGPEAGRGPDALGAVAFVCVDPGVPVFGTKGCSIHAQAVLAELARRADVVHLLTTRVGGVAPPAAADVVVHRLDRPSGVDARRERAVAALDDALADRLDAIAGRGRIDLVYERFSLFSAGTQLHAARRGWPSALEINAPLIDEQARHRTLVDRAGAVAAARQAITAATFPFGVSTEVARWASTLTGADVAVVPNGVDLARFAPPGLIDPPGPGSEPLTLCFVGTYKPWHDLDALVVALAALVADPTVPPVRLLLVGDGPQRPALLADLDRAGLGRHVTATGALPPDEVARLLGTADVALAPYGVGPGYFSPLKVFEYLAAGCAVVASGLGDLPRLLGPDAALLVPPGDTPAFVAAVARVARQPRLRRSLADGGRRAVAARTWRAAIDGVVAGARPAPTGGVRP